MAPVTEYHVILNMLLNLISGLVIWRWRINGLAKSTHLVIGIWTCTPTLRDCCCGFLFTMAKWALAVSRIAGLSLSTVTYSRLIVAAVTWINLARTGELVIFIQPLWATSDGLLLLRPSVSFLLPPYFTLLISSFSLFSYFLLSFLKNSFDQSTSLFDTLLQGKQWVVRGLNWTSLAKLSVCNRTSRTNQKLK